MVSDSAEATMLGRGRLTPVCVLNEYPNPASPSGLLSPHHAIFLSFCLQFLLSTSHHSSQLRYFAPSSSCYLAF